MSTSSHHHHITITSTHHHHIITPSIVNTSSAHHQHIITPSTRKYICSTPSNHQQPISNPSPTYQRQNVAATFEPRELQAARCPCTLHTQPREKQGGTVGLPSKAVECWSNMIVFIPRHACNSAVAPGDFHCHISGYRQTQSAVLGDPYY